MGNRNRLAKEPLEFYLKAGYTVLSVDYRLAPETKLEEIVQDIKDAIIWVQNNDQLKIDKTRIYVIGHSAGGYLALQTGYILDNPPRAIVSFYGYGDIQGGWLNQPDSFYIHSGIIEKEKALKSINKATTTLSNNDRYNFYIYCRQQGIWTKMISGHDPQSEPEYFKRFCPIQNISGIFPPVFLIHGDEDTDVPFEQSLLMSQALKEKGVENQFIKMNGFGHAFDRSNGGLSDPIIADIFYEVIKFLEKYK